MPIPNKKALLKELVERAKDGVIQGSDVDLAMAENWIDSDFLPDVEDEIIIRDCAIVRE